MILGRVLREGGLSHAQLMRARVGDEAIRAFILRHRDRGMSPNRLRFWQLLLGLPSRRPDAWVRTARLVLARTPVRSPSDVLDREPMPECSNRGPGPR